jgi:hypothetical protein
MTDSGTAPSPDARALRNHQVRKYRLIVLVVVLVAVTTLVLMHGVDGQGIMLIGVAVVLTAVRAWQYWAMRPPGQR